MGSFHARERMTTTLEPRIVFDRGSNGLTRIVPLGPVPANQRSSFPSFACLPFACLQAGKAVESPWQANPLPLARALSACRLALAGWFGGSIHPQILLGVWSTHEPEMQKAELRMQNGRPLAPGPHSVSQQEGGTHICILSRRQRG
jgi:hypothetical protein